MLWLLLCEGTWLKIAPTRMRGLLVCLHPIAILCGRCLAYGLAQRSCGAVREVGFLSSNPATPVGELLQDVLNCYGFCYWRGLALGGLMLQVSFHCEDGVV